MVYLAEHWILAAQWECRCDGKFARDCPSGMALSYFNRLAMMPG
jgi:hypothetical protein